MIWLRQNLGSVITVGVLLAGFVSGYSLLQYRVNEIERILHGDRLSVLEREMNEKIERVKTDFQNERVLLWTRIIALETKK